MRSTGTSPQHRRRERFWLLVGAAVLATALAGTLAWTTAGASSPLSPLPYPSTPVLTGAPDVVEIVVDDMDDFSCADTRKYLPESSRWLLHQGTCYENASVTDPVCCPARAEIQSGQMPHNNHVGRQADAHHLDYHHTVQYRLGLEGTTTYGVGKELNGVKTTEYRTSDGRGSFVTGFAAFDFWDSYDYRHFTITDQDGRTFAPSAPAHTTVVTGELLRSSIQHSLATGEHFLKYAAFYAPHEQVGRGTTRRDQFPSPTAANAHTAVPPFRFDPEKDARDKLPFFRNRNLPGSYYAAENAARVRSLYDVDHQVAQTFQMLQDSGALAHTIVLLMSDNGYLLGQHNWEGKAVPYTQAVDVPLLAYGPSYFSPGTVDRRLVSLLDVAPTIYQLEGVDDPGYVVDGHSLLGAHRRRFITYEYTTEQDALVREESGHATSTLPSWNAIRIGNDTYIEWHNARRTQEFYTSLDQSHNLLYHHRLTRPERDALGRFRRPLHRDERCEGTVEQHSARPCS